MNTSYTMYSEMNVAPLCFAPFSVTDMVYNPGCYTQPILESLKGFMQLYMKCNLLLINGFVSLVQTFWFPIMYCLILGTLIYFGAYMLLCDDTDEPLTPLQSEIAQYIQMNASTGSTARMICEHLTDYYDGYPVRIEEVQRGLQQLKKRGVILSTQATLWLISGN